MKNVECSGKTDTGLRRYNNEDAIVVRPDLGFVALADGMGGASSGEVASAIFIETALNIFSEAPSGRTAQEAVQEAFFLANDKIWSDAKNNGAHSGMGCTGEIFAFDDNHYIIGHVGDSRTYMSRKGRLRQITRDHSVVQDQIDRGFITPEEARKHSLKNVIVRAVGAAESITVDIIRGAIQPGDTFLLCSDGLNDMLTDDKISEIINLDDSLDNKIQTLIDLANDAGGHDNITAVLVRFPHAGFNPAVSK